jgi:hypothetical protein
MMACQQPCEKVSELALRYYALNDENMALLAEMRVNHSQVIDSIRQLSAEVVRLVNVVHELSQRIQVQQ